MAIYYRCRHAALGHKCPNVTLIDSESPVRALVNAVSETPLSERQVRGRNKPICEAYRGGAYSLTQIAGYFGIRQSTASRIARQWRTHDAIDSILYQVKQRIVAPWILPGCAHTSIYAFIS